MISILIPVYNTSVVNLVEDLSTQLEIHGLKGEIVVFDDFSDDAFRVENRVLSLLQYVNYKELNSNRGRVEIRKELVSVAKYEWLLFIDGDSQIVRKDYLTIYFNRIKNDYDVITGGRIYTSIPPIECNKRLHWKYGRIRETNAFTLRRKFHSNNFCIKKRVYNQFHFPGSLKGYGHEDTWMGMQLEVIGARIHIIDNPVLHDGIERSDVFLDKANNALRNLLILSTYYDSKLLQKHVRLFDAFCKVKRFKIEKLFLFIFKLTKKIILSNLQSCHPSLVLFDLYRFGKLLEMDKLH